MVYIILNEVFFAFIEGFIFFFIFLFVANNMAFLKEHKIRTLFTLLIYTFYSYWIMKLIPYGLHTIFYIIFTLALFSFMTKTKLAKSIISVAVGFVFDGCLQVFIVMPVSFAIGIPIEGMVNSPQITLYMLIVIRTIEIVLLYILFKKKSKFWNIFDHGVFDKGNYVISYLVLELMVGIMMLIAQPEKNNGLYYQFFLFALFVTVLIIGIFDIRERFRVIDIDKKFIAQKEYIMNMETIVRIIRREKHDYNNHLATLIAMCSQDKEDTIERIRSYTKQLLAIPGTSSYKFYDSGNTYVDGLLAVKHNYAMENNINLDIDFEESLDKAVIDPVDLTSIIGNILDNAMETHVYFPKDGENRVVSVNTYIDEDDNSFTIAISNNGVPIPEDCRKKIFSESYSTKATITKRERGFGLYIVDQLVKKYKGKIEVKSDEYETVFLVKLPYLFQHACST